MSSKQKKRDRNEMKNGERHVSFILVLIQIAHMSFVPTSEARAPKDGNDER